MLVSATRTLFFKEPWAFTRGLPGVPAYGCDLKVGFALVLLFCRSQLIRDNASSPSVRRAMSVT